MQNDSFVNAFLALTSEIDIFWNLFLVVTAAFTGWIYRYKEQFHLRRILVSAYFALWGINLGSLWQLADLRSQAIRDLTALVGNDPSRFVYRLNGFPWSAGVVSAFGGIIFFEVIGLVFIFCLGLPRRRLFGWFGF